MALYRPDSVKTLVSTGKKTLKHRPRFVAFSVLLAFGIMLGIGTLVLIPWIRQSVVSSLWWISLGVIGAGGLGVYLFQLSNTQRYYLDMIDYERSELQEYQKQLLTISEVSESEELPPEVCETSESEELPPEVCETSESEELPPEVCETYRLVDTAICQLARAETAVYHEDFVSFLSTFYHANAQRVFVYAHLDAAAQETAPKRVDWSLSICPRGAPDQEVKKEGVIDQSPSDDTETRRWNVAKWLLSVAESLPDAERNAINGYLLGSETTLRKSPSAQSLYRALGVIQAWDVQRMSALMSIKRALRLLIPTLAALLFTILAIVWRENIDIGPVFKEVDGGLFIVFVVLAGVAGAAFSMMLFMRDTSSKVTSYQSIPDPSILKETVVTSLLVGGISAIVLYVLLRSSLGGAIFAEEIRGNPLSILFIAFLGGYSERLIERSLENAEQLIAQKDHTDAEPSPEQRPGE